MPKLKVYVGGNLVLDVDTKQVKGSGADSTLRTVQGARISSVYVNIGNANSEEAEEHRFNVQTGEAANEATTKFMFAHTADSDVVVNFEERVNPDYASE